ncbi:hybrid NRPS/PKS enzyme [Cordyceps javanica]|uniref:Hybrid NRPS/PKS enzyme n=1 Tax=Cordyceps javanica TaxID=43265 RepID=A0A545UY56_9HYPO|nr:hybrid NRPS/PKS enzyme [Cordyceps javanica]TQW06254.1 hybrid NRPS/PKS enzyme [Cordyceps javanica]
MTIPFNSEPIAVVGTACRFPGGCDSPSKLWELLKKPRDIVQKIPHSRFDIDAFYHPEATHHGTTNTTRAYFLEQDISRFDAGFFHIQPMEADSVDPQQRLLLETVYDALQAGGLPIEKLRGSSTAVYVGMMCDDWTVDSFRDWEALPTYIATGTARSIMANRVSYFFDWHGPSMTIDTACSSSLVALHHAVQSLRSGEANVAIAAGTNLLLSPGMYISESNLRMLSPSGHCAMWDESADGYARGEGVASVVLKTLSHAIADGDNIECIIRETAVNQDGRTSGLTMPSHNAQASLIRETYRRAGLDLENPLHRPQFFHAHGTGTQAGDPQEAEAISQALFPNGSPDGRTLHVGSIKTVLGHTESTAGLAALVGTSLSMRHGIIPPNLHFNKINDKVAPFCEHLVIPTTPTPWPEIPVGCAKRASINSFGFGGTNAHAIVESYEPGVTDLTNVEQKPTSPLLGPFVFSANSDTALQATIAGYVNYLSSNPGVNLHDLAKTLQLRRSTLPHRAAFVADNLEALSFKLAEWVSVARDNSDVAATRHPNVASPKVLGIFTGQGAQWPRMGAALIESSAFARRKITELDRVLQELPLVHRPSWKIENELLAGAETSRISEALISQPLCLAVQVVLVDLLRAAGIEFTAVVGHSSGEIGAAYAAGLLSAHDAICIAYYRGFYAYKAASSREGHRGAMLAVGISHEVATDFTRQDQFADRLQIAAVNSESSVTLSGDEDAADEAIEVFKHKSIFCRRLKVDTAYHSFHMKPCAEAYLEAISAVTPVVSSKRDVKWFSSVNEGEQMSEQNLTSQYWVDNMCNTVLFSAALSDAILECGPFDLALEVGPHAALKAPATSIIQSLGPMVPYTGILSRGKCDRSEISATLGFMWMHLGSPNIDFDAVATLLSGAIHAGRPDYSVLKNLPNYPFDHQRSFWISSRLSNHYKFRKEAPNPILGTVCADVTTKRQISWRNILRPSEISWLSGHMLQGQIVFPATAYICMAVEAIKSLAKDSEVALFTISDLDIYRAITFNDESSSIETLFSLTSVENVNDAISAEFACYSVASGDSTSLIHAKGRAAVHLRSASRDTLPIALPDRCNLVDVDTDKFYQCLNKLGYNYSSPFCGLQTIQRARNFSTGVVLDQSTCTWEDNLVVHPGLLDTALQSAFAAWAFPGDGTIWSLHVPTHISLVSINPHLIPLDHCGTKTAKFAASIRDKGPSSSIVADIQLFSLDEMHCIVSIENASLIPFAPATAANDKPLFSHFSYAVSQPSGQLAALENPTSAFEHELFKDLDRISYWYMRTAAEAFPIGQRKAMSATFKYYLRWCDRMVVKVTRGEYPIVPPECNNDAYEDIKALVNRYPKRGDVRFIDVVGEHLIQVLRTGGSVLEYMNKDNLMLDVYENGLGVGTSNRRLVHLVKQISHRYPQANILEIGAGSAATAKTILSAIDGAFSSYTFTDISSGYFPAAEEVLEQHLEKLIFKTFDMTQDPRSQGFTDATYEIIVATNVLHVSGDIDQTISNIRRLIRPGGYLVFLEMTSTDIMYLGMSVGTLPGWWLGAEKGRPWGSAFTMEQWDETLRKNGFSGIDTYTPDLSAHLKINVIVSQAVDDQIMLLRDPLVIAEGPEAEENKAKTSLEMLAVIGGSTMPICELAEDISSSNLSAKFTILLFETLEDWAASEEYEHGAVHALCLTDLDEPFMRSLTPTKFSALKDLWSRAKTVMWVTQNAREGEPYSFMMTGIGRTVHKEYPNIHLQIFDVEEVNTVDTARLLSEAFARHHVLSSHAIDQRIVLWSIEPEMAIKSGLTIIPRLVPDKAKNRRYNSQKRTITYHQPSSEPLQLVGSGTSPSAFVVKETSPIRFWADLPTDYRKVRITHSVLQSLFLQGDGDSGFLRLCHGVDESSGKSVLALSSSTESPAFIPSEWCFEVIEYQNIASALIAVAAALIANTILSMVPRSGSLLISEPEPVVAAALRKMASQSRIKVLFITSRQDDVCTRGDADWLYIHPNASSHFIEANLPSSPVAFVHFARNNATNTVNQRIIGFLPAHCLCFTEGSLISNAITTNLPTRSVGQVAARFRYTIEETTFSESGAATVILDQVSTKTAPGQPLTVVDWISQPLVTVESQSIGAGIFFRSDKTYWLVGFASGLGQSLCHWMIDHGARHIVISSRTPKVDPIFIKSMANNGANVQVISCDVTNRISLRKSLKTITTTMPPVAGLVNGAMVLDDSFLDRMTHEQFIKVIKPKVEGTKLLDEMFFNTTLDFFVVTSSITTVYGLSGQSNYSAANLFMTASGVGYAAQADNFDFDTFESMGNITISDQDFCHLFAEAILSGRPTSTDEAEIISGVNYVSSELHINETYRRDVKFARFERQENTTSSRSGAGTTSNVRDELEAVTTKPQAYKIIQDSFVSKLKRILQISEEDPIDFETGLVDLGLDSLIAVEVRAWFMKQIDVDIPVLKILGGCSILNLIDIAMENISSAIFSASASHTSADVQTESPTPTTSAAPQQRTTVAYFKFFLLSTYTFA